MNYLTQIKEKLSEQATSLSLDDKEISPEMLEKIVNQVAGGAVWCKASWAESCDSSG